MHALASGCLCLPVVSEREAAHAVPVAHRGPCLTSAGTVHPRPAVETKTKHLFKGAGSAFLF